MNNAVIDYYNESEIDYRLLWGLGRNYAIHYGYYDAQHTNHDEAVLNFNSILASTASIKSTDIVLDAGCGIGGSALWLAEHVGCKVVGLTIVPRQLENARLLAKKHGVEHLASFELQDYTKTSFPDNYFDVVWGLESICYAKDKKDFLTEAHRILKSGGRIVVADGFTKNTPRNQRERYEQAKWLEGWAVPNLASSKSFFRDLQDVGFEEITFADVTSKVFPSSQRMYRASLLARPLSTLMQYVGLRTKVQTGNVLSAYYQYKAMKDNLWLYGIYSARKP